MERRMTSFAHATSPFSLSFFSFLFFFLPQACLQVCLNQSVLSPNGLFPGSDSFPAGLAIRDMGGCFIDLDGGEYLISQPLVIPELNANMQLGEGSLVGMCWNR